MKNKGFTLVELVIVMSIVGLLISIVVPMVMNHLNQKGQPEQLTISTNNVLEKDDTPQPHKAHPSEDQLVALALAKYEHLNKELKVILEKKDTKQTPKSPKAPQHIQSLSIGSFRPGDVVKIYIKQE